MRVSYTLLRELLTKASDRRLFFKILLNEILLLFLCCIIGTVLGHYQIKISFISIALFTLFNWAILHSVLCRYHSLPKSL